MFVSNIFFLIIVGPAIAAPVARLRDEARLVTAGTPPPPPKGMTGKVPAVAVTTNPQQEQEPNIPEAPEALEGPEAPDTFDAPYTIDPLPYHNPTPEAANYPDAANHADAATYPETANYPEVASYPNPHDEQHAANVEKINDRKAFHASRVEKWNYTWGHYPVTRKMGQPVQPGTPGTGGGHHVKSCPANKDYSKCITH
ncbi:glutamate n-methyl d-aspartate-associated protein 1 (glutamate binding) [Colletotrichum asianum]|uniref:Glutamate n-methyl d-aspartate-associated protein 1 (Glutamate binding) n=1 Tax=Colletotrichum asianum TaxID=702518 RepID=A0A8H3VXS8_9PEZI|nr:glutamate n-methyl d-aspartate-associated protein 1 (glutamate binding) [Colletotrichum asianum]